MVQKISKKQPNTQQLNLIVAVLLIIGACLLFVFWYTKSYLSPSNVFWGTISSNLSVDHVTRSSSKSEGNQRLNQVNNLQFDPALIAQSIVTLENTETKEKVVTETIGTTNADYLRYVEITSNTSNNASNAVVGQWAKHEAAKDEQPQILPEALLGSVLMFGDLSSSQRQQLISQLQTNNSFKKYDLIAKKTVDGHKVYTFNVSIDLDSYSKVYADYLKMLGQDKLAEQIGQQQSGATYDFILDISANSRTPLKLSLKDSEEFEQFSNVGSGPRIVTPEAAMTIAELQAKISGN